MAHDIFISYSTKDKYTADAICHVLEQNNLKCWIAPRNIASGKNYAQEIMNGLKAAKVVVLVFSKNSQESAFVNNEIDAAFSNNKSIISFKIDETMPENRMEFFLKNKHWLEAYPEPEKVFETLVTDATRLCKEAPTVIVSKPTPANAASNVLPTRQKDLISLILLFTPFYFVSFLYMGFVAKVKEWMALGIVFFIPLIFLFMNMGDPMPMYTHASQMGLSINLFLVFWILAFIIGIFIIRKEFLARKTVLDLMPPEEELFDNLVEQYINV
ncbi:toll/interleukin-1 receptor domain-containing protein [Methanobrevibacter sp.]|uniref:toll/interleukin-1 receptor domain-containing protein n=1 Tax=Methanobrevibacter sp. TaxID=66852 RepID=UPI00388D3ED6